MVVEIRCVAPLEQCRRRVADRPDARLSEATPEVVDLMAERSELWPEATIVATGDVDESMVVSVLAVFQDLWWRTGPAPLA